jgi:N-acetylglucosaminyldiphosphoundecaprenol N-acetyl-beta-D-mannosaminyltransferase
VTVGTIPFLGLCFLDLDAAAVADLLARRPTDAGFAYLVTPNADHFVHLRRSPDLAALYEEAAWLCLDSRALSHAARALGLYPPAVATGADILAAILDRHLRPGDRVTIIGCGATGVASLRLRLPGAVVAHHQPPPRLAHDPEGFSDAVAFATAHPARFIVIALGSPLQERLAAAIQRVGGTGIGLCVGAGLDFWTGTTPRAPRWVRRLGLEWTFRLAQEPQRLARRYLIDDWAVLRILLTAWWHGSGRYGGRDRVGGGGSEGLR